MSNTLLTPDVIAKEALRQLENSLVMANLVHRDYEAEFGETKIGETVRIRRPVRYTVREGNVAQVQDTTEGRVSLTVDRQRGVDIDFLSRDLTLTIDKFSERYVKPAMIQIANRVDMDLFGLYKDVWNWVGDPGQTINSFADLTEAPLRLDEMAVPLPRNMVLSPTDHWGLIGSFSQLPAISDVARTALQKAKLPMTGNMDMYMAQNVVAHTVGTGTGTPLVDGAGQGVTYLTSKDTGEQSLVTDGWTASEDLKQGDVFTIDGVFAVNPVSKATLSFLQQFVLKADVTTNGTTTLDTTLTISPPIITSGPYQTVSAAPGDGATIVYMGTAVTSYRQNLAFHKSAFALAMVPMELPDAAVKKARESYNGLSVRVISTYDGTNDRSMWRFDVLYGVRSIYPDLATRASGST